MPSALSTSNDMLYIIAPTEASMDLVSNLDKLTGHVECDVRLTQVESAHCFLAGEDAPTSGPTPLKFTAANPPAPASPAPGFGSELSLPATPASMGRPMLTPIGGEDAGIDSADFTPATPSLINVVPQRGADWNAPMPVGTGMQKLELLPDVK